MRKLLFFIYLLIAVAASAQEAIPANQAIDYYHLDKKTNLHDRLAWDEIEPFINGFSRVLKNGLFSFINQKKELIMPVQFEGARNFCNKFSAVKKNGKWGYINETGKMVIPTKYDIVFDFKERSTVVLKGSKWFLINTAGIILKELDITIFYGFENGYAKVEKEGLTGIMDLSGKIIYDHHHLLPASSRLPAFTSAVNSSSVCPDNIDFEYGSFLNWKCFTGSVDSVGNINMITVTQSAATPNRHTLYNRILPSPLDAFGLFPTNPPDGSNFAVRLGNTQIGAEAERIQYKIRVPVNDSNFSIKYDYAVVFEDPGHTTWTQPRFTAKLFDSAANAYVACASFEYIATSSLPGFVHSTVDTAVMFKPWSSVFVSLRGYSGKTMFLEFTTADCVRRGHWGYAYLDVEKPCGQSVQVQYECTSPNITNLDAPPGFQSYNWWDSSYTNLLGMGQHVILNPGPPANSLIWLEMIPFNDFGCRDSMPVRIAGVFNANFDVSDTAAVCAPHSFTFYNRNIPSTFASWDFGDGSTAIGDTVSHIYLIPGNYIVTLNVILPSGCIGKVQKNVLIRQPVGSFYFNGSYFCNSQQVKFDAVVNSADSLFWNFGDGTYSAGTQTTVYHSYLLPGIYLPYLTVQSSFGCQNTVPSSDTIRIERLRAGFNYSVQKTCGQTFINLVDSSYSYFGINDHQWDFGDGTTGTGININHAYTNSGIYNIQLIVTGISGCRDTIIIPVNIQIYNMPVANIIGPLVQCQNASSLFNASITSPDTINILEWTTSNGAMGSGNSFSYNFIQPGDYTIQLVIGTVNNCFDTVNHPITINPGSDVTQPSDQSVCNGSYTAAVQFYGTIPGSTYTWSNDMPQIGLAATGTGNIPSFNAINNGSVPISATITVSPLATGCAGPSKTFSIIVLPTPVMVEPLSQVLCKNELTFPISFNSSVNSTAYTWTNNNTLIGLAANGSSDIPPFTAINNTTLPVTALVTVNGSANGCPALPKTFEFTVNPMPAVTQPADHIYCNGTITPVIYFATAVNGPGFSWINDNPSIGLASSGSGNIPAFTAINNSNANVTATITVFATANSCPGPPKTFSITIRPTATIIQPADQVICNGSPVTANIFNSLVTGSTFSWINNIPSIGLALAGSGTIPAFTAINTSDTTVTATISVTATINNCPGETKSFKFIIKPTPKADQPPSLVLCNGAPTEVIDLTSTIPGTTFSWTNSQVTIGLAASGNGNIGSFTAINNTNVPVQSTVTVTPTANGCPGLPKNFNITVNPTPTVLQPGSQVVCNGTNTTAIIFAESVNDTDFDWVNNDTSVGLAAGGTGDIPSFIAVNNSNVPVIATITVTPTAFNCPGSPKTFTITINPSPVITQLSDQAVCNGMSTSPIFLASSTGGTTYSWTNSNPSVGLASSGSGNIDSFLAVNNTSATIIAVINISATAYGCTGRVKTTNINIYPTPDIIAGNDRIVCLGSSVQLSASGAAQYSWSPADSLSCGSCANPIALPQDGLQLTVQGTSSFGCIGYDSILLKVIRPFIMLVDPGDTLCVGRSTGLTALQANSYLWSPSAGLDRTDIAAPTATPTVTTNYRVIGYDAYNCFTDTGYVLVTVGPKPLVNIGNDISASTGSVVTLHANTQNGPIINYSWSPATNLSCTDCETPVAVVKNNIEYAITVTNIFGCQATDILRINVFCQSGQVFIPNSFTPDGDGLNDIFMIRGKGITVKSFRIFNRWGELVFEKKNFNPNDPAFAWDGKVRGKAATPDVFVYTADVVCDNNVVYTYKGNTTILK
ncbi:MAG: PKD domain-containing protein [Ferruginibacter sp.]